MQNNLALRDKSPEIADNKEDYLETREDYLLPGRNGLESAVIISDQLGNVWGGPKLMEREKVKFILRTLNENEIRYAIIGGVAMGQLSIQIWRRLRLKSFACAIYNKRRYKLHR